LVINKCVTAVKVSNFSGHYLRNRSTLDIGVLGYIGIVQHKEHSPEVFHIPPGTLCIIGVETQITVYRNGQLHMRTGQRGPGPDGTMKSEGPGNERERCSFSELARETRVPPVCWVNHYTRIMNGWLF